MASQSYKRRRADSHGRSSAPPFDDASSEHDEPASRLGPNDVLRTIDSLGRAWPKDTVFDLVLGVIDQNDVKKQVQDSFEAAQSNAARKKERERIHAAKRRERNRIKREERKVIYFDHYVCEIADWFNNPPRCRDAYPEAVCRHEKIVARIKEIVEKGNSPNMRKETRVHALEALLDIAILVKNSRQQAIGSHIIGRWIKDPIVEQGMLKILTTMPDDYRSDVCTRAMYDGPFKMDTLEELAESGLDVTSGEHYLFERLHAVISLMDEEGTGFNDGKYTDVLDDASGSESSQSSDLPDTPSPSSRLIGDRAHPWMSQEASGIPSLGEASPNETNTKVEHHTHPDPSPFSQLIGDPAYPWIKAESQGGPGIPSLGDASPNETNIKVEPPIRTQTKHEPEATIKSESLPRTTSRPQIVIKGETRPVTAGDSQVVVKAESSTQPRRSPRREIKSELAARPRLIQTKLEPGSFTLVQPEPL